MATKYGVIKTAISKWKNDFLGKGSYTTMNRSSKRSSHVTDKCDLKATKDPKVRELKAEVDSLNKQIYHMKMELDALKVASEVIKKDRSINLTELNNLEKADVINALKNNYRLAELLKLFNIPKSSYFYKLTVKKSIDKYYELRNKVRNIFDSSHKTYGYRRINVMLKRENYIVSDKVIIRIMNEEGLHVYVPKCKKYSSYKSEISQSVPNIVKRNFHSKLPNKILFTDITEFAIPAGKVYLSPIIDCFDGIVISWSIGESPNAELANSMLRNTIAKLKDGEQPIIHSDRGCHYHWTEWISLTTQAGIIRSMSKKGCSPDNAACEGFFGRLKNEMFYNRSWINMQIKEFINVLDNYIHWYNEKRIKMSLGGKSPVEYRCSLGLNY